MPSSIRTPGVVPTLAAVDTLPQLPRQYTPVVSGLTTPGAGTYTLQEGWYIRQERLVTFFCRVTWSAHTGTGQISLNLPFPALPTSFCITNLSVDGFALPAGSFVVGLINNSTQLDVFSNAAGTLANINVNAPGRIFASGTYISKD
jgi:hypothetical protein